MLRRAWGPFLAALSLFLGAAGDAGAGEEVAVARANIRASALTEAAGIVFFLPVEDAAGAAAVGAAHSFDLGRLATGNEVEFRLGARGARVAVSNRFLVEPGRAFHLPGASLRDDFVVFALDASPVGVRTLEPGAKLPKPGERVRVLGIPAVLTRDEEDLFGTVVQSTRQRIEVDLDTPADLRGWGGAPVLSAGDDRVLGLLQAAWPSAQTLRVGVAPIGGVLDALKRPLEGGLGKPFAAFAAAAPHPTAGAPEPAPPAPARDARATRPSEPAGESKPQTRGDTPITLRLEVEYPEDGAVIGNSQGAFLAGRALALLGDFQRFDVVFVIDTSGSTNEPTGVDVNGNGVVGAPRLGTFGGIFGLGTTDAGDSILSAEIAAAGKLLQSLDARNTRVGLITFAGEPSRHRPGTIVIGGRRGVVPAITEEPLTSDYARLSKTLTRVRERGSAGMTHMAAGVDRATIELLGLRGSLSKPDRMSEKIVLFFTDGQPTLPYDGFTADNVRAVLRAADRARRASVRIHSFAIGPKALEGPIATVEMALITDGVFTPVRDPGALVNTIEAVSFANIEEVSVRNVTTGDPAHAVHTNADGSWNALVPLKTGMNRLEVSARTSDGAVQTRRLTVHYAPGAADPFLAPELVARRNLLLEQRLIELRRGSIEVERQRAEQTRRQLRLEIERERARAADRAAQQRKELELEVEPDASGSGG